RKRTNADGSSAHCDSTDSEFGFLADMYKAPLGSTPCETAYNAYLAASDTLARQFNGVVPPHGEFIERCGTLPELVQQCLAPRYWRDHRDACDQSTPPPMAART